MTVNSLCKCPFCFSIPPDDTPVRDSANVWQFQESGTYKTAMKLQKIKQRGRKIHVLAYRTFLVEGFLKLSDRFRANAKGWAVL